MILKNKLLILYFILLLISFFNFDNKIINKPDQYNKIHIEEDLSTNLQIGGIGCDVDHNSNKFLCESFSNDFNTSTHLLILGDSHARHYYYGMKYLSELLDFNFSIIQLPHDCNIVSSLSNSHKCQIAEDLTKNYIKEKDITKIIFSYKWSNFNYEITYEDIDNKIESFFNPYKTLEFLTILDNIELNIYHPEICFSNNIFYEFFKIDRCLNSNYVKDNNFNFIEKINTKIKDNIESVNMIYINPNDYICTNKCVAKRNNNFLFSDRHHLSTYGSKFIIESSIETLKEFIFKQ